MSVRAKKVVVVVFDGLRPDMVTADTMPTLAGFAESSLWFSRSRTVFPSVTRVATTSFATGSPPAVHGILGNTFHQPDAAPQTLIDTSKLADIARADAHFGGRLVTATSLGEALASAGRTMMVVHGGSPGASWFLNHRAVTNGHWTFSIHGREATQTAHAIADAEAVVGPAPALDVPRHAVVEHCALVMTKVVLPRAPDLAVMWLPEPDTSFHYREIGSQPTRTVMKTSDRAFAAVLDAVREGPDTNETMVIALSDHGQLTVTEKVEAARLFGLEDEVARGDVLLTGGRYGELRCPDGDRGRLMEIARHLLAEEKVGHVLARDDLAAQMDLIPFSALGVDHPRQPDLIFVMRAQDRADHHGLGGTGFSTEGVPAGGGMHGGLHPMELANVLAVRAPNGRRGADDGPAGLIDVAPTILAALDVPRPQTMLGRPLPLGLFCAERPCKVEVCVPHGSAMPVAVWESGGVRYIGGTYDRTR